MSRDGSARACAYNIHTNATVEEEDTYEIIGENMSL